jgi:acyl-CoA synthetase (AMP-forming)/AMP-acid ligase II
MTDRPPLRWLGDLLADIPRESLAVIDHDGARLSYGDLDDRAAEVESALRKWGVRPGDRVMVVTENSAAFAAAILAIARADAWVIPVNARHRDEEIRAIAAHSGARTILFTPDASPDAARHAEAFGATPLISHPDARLLASPVTDTTAEPVPNDPSERVAALLYTTGTTSAPKGVMLTHANLLWNARVSGRTRRLAAEDQVLAILPGTHIYCFSSGILAALHAGASIRFIPRFSPEAVLQAFAEGASMMPAVPQMYQAVVGLLRSRGERPVAPRLRLISSGGAPLDPDWKAGIEAFFGLTLHNGYGLTETSPGVTVTRIDGPDGDLSCGLPVEGVEIRIDGEDAEGVGEVQIRSPGVMKGYYRNPEATAAVLDADGWFRSGDLGWIGPRGELYISGRKKELIVRSGFNVHPPEIEAMLTRHPQVRQAAVVGRSVKGDEEIVAFLLVEPDLEPDDLREWLKERLVAYKVPQHLIFVEAYPTAPTGKILKHRLLAHFADRLPKTGSDISDCA